MPNAFTIFGTLELDSSRLKQALDNADSRLADTTKLLSHTENATQALGKSSAVTARQFEKLDNSVQDANVKLKTAADAFAKGEITSKQMTSAIAKFDTTVDRATNKLKDMDAKLRDVHDRSNMNLHTLSKLGNVMTGLNSAFQMVTGSAFAMYRGLQQAGDAAYQFMKTASDFGSEFHDMSTLTGMSAESLSAMSIALEQSGSSLETMVKPLGKFSVLLADAASGSEKAAASLTQLGLDPQRAMVDLEGSLDKVIERIKSAESPTEKWMLASEAFGQRGAAAVLKFIEQADGTIPELTAKFRAMGLTMTNENAAAADELGDQMILLGTQFKMVGFQVAREFMPMVTNGINQVSAYLVANKGVASDWGRALVTHAQGIGVAYTALARVANDAFDALTLGMVSTANKSRVWAATIEVALNIVSAGFYGVTKRLGELFGSPIDASGITSTIDGINDRVKSAGQQFKDTDELIERFNRKSVGQGFDEWVKGFKTGGDEGEKAIKKIGGAAKALNKDFKDTKITMDSLLSAMRGSTMTQESGGRKTIQNDRTGAAGLFQVLPKNIPSWTKEALGKSLSLDQFKASTAAQIQVFNHFMGDYLKKALQQTAGDWQKAVRMAAAAWYGGEGAMDKYNANFGGKGKEPTFREYTSSVLNRVTKSLGGGGGEVELTNIFTEALRQQEEQVRKSLAAWDAFKESITPAKTEMQKFRELFADKTVMAEFMKLPETVREQMLVMGEANAIATDYANIIGKLADNAERLAEMEIDLGLAAPQRTGTGPMLGDDAAVDVFGVDSEIPPPPLAPWENFWATMAQRLEAFKQSLPSLKQALGENLVASIENIGSVFGNAIAQWDGTAKGFFKSLAQGFRQMVSQIVAELVRLLVIKAIMQVVGGLAGGFGGSGGADAGGFIPGIGGMAEGGPVYGRGTSTSDSILARLSNGEFVMKAKAVKQWGVGFFDQLNNGLQMPQMAFAGGGYVGGMSSSMVTNNTTSNQPINVYVQGGGTREQNQLTGYQIATALQQKMEHNNRRNK